MFAHQVASVHAVPYDQDRGIDFLGHGYAIHGDAPQIYVELAVKVSIINIRKLIFITAFKALIIKQVITMGVIE